MILASLVWAACVLGPEAPSPGPTRPIDTTLTTMTTTGQPGTAATADTSPLPSRTGDTGAPHQQVIDNAPSLRLAQGGDPDFHGMAGQVAVLDFLDSPGLEVATGRRDGPTYVWTLADQRGTADPKGQLAFTLDGGKLGVLSRDIDGDGRSDLLLHDGFLDGFWTVHPSPYDPATVFELYDIGGHANTTCLADLDADGHIDLMLRRDFGDEADVFFGPFEPGEYRPQADLPRLTFDQAHVTEHILCPGDVTGDGVPDLLNVGGKMAIYDAVIERDTTEMTGARLLPFERVQEPPHVFDHPTAKGAQALLTAGYFPNVHRIVSLPLTDIEHPEVIGTLEREGGVSALPCDLDGDGVTDILTTQSSGYGHTVRVFYGPLVGHRQSHDWDLEIRTYFSSMDGIATDDIDQDGFDDLIVTGEYGTSTSDELHVYFGPLPRPGQPWVP